MPRVKCDDEDKVLACPECGLAGDIYERTHTGNPYVGDPDDRFSCGLCSASFEEPVVRPPKRGTGGGVSKLERLIQEGKV